jgi:DNA (cytosine-5)-methyltransferase 1
MNYGSLFSGIEAASLAFEPLGWKPKWFSEIDPFCCKVLSTRWNNIPNLGDITNPNLNPEYVDLIVGGSPCPSFSLSGKRKGMLDPRGKLTLRYIEIINLVKPKWFIWENVPGVLSSNNGEDFKVVIDEMVKCGYGLSWRVLDARCFGLPQSRKRIYMVGRLGAKCPPEILFETQSDQESPQQHEQGGKIIASANSDLDGIPICLRGREHGTMIEFMDYFGCLRAMGGYARNFVWDGHSIRSLTPNEYERLQGMSGTHTLIEGADDDNRFKAAGNSMAVPVVRWIGERIQKFDINSKSVFV